MGYWWKLVKDFPEDQGFGLTLTKDRQAFLKEKAPIIWRFQHRWKIIEVSHTTSFDLYYDDGTEKRRFHKPIKKRFFATRIGPRNVTFAAFDRDGEIPLVMETAVDRYFSYFEILAIVEGGGFNYRYHGNTEMV